MKRSLENMNIALIHEWITNVAGSERVLLTLKEIFPKAPIFTSVFDSKKAKPFSKFDVRTSFLQKWPFLKSKRELLIPLTPFAFEQFDLSKYNLVISSSSMAAKGVITKPDTIHISYCHTPPRYLWEPQIDPRAKGGLFGWLKTITSHKMRIWDKVAADRVDHFIANSKYVAKRIKKYYGRESIVIYPPIDIEKYRPSSKVEIQDYFLFVSRLVGYKKCDLVVDAFNELGWPLKVIGQGPEKENLIKKAKSNIEFLGFLPDEKVVEFYQKAKAFVFAAEEDFGIVPVEAMAAGRPVIAYRQGGQSEAIIEGVTGEFFDNQTKESLVKSLRAFDFAKYKTDEIQKQAEKYSKEVFKQTFMRYLENILS